jgi:hypothetical protein
LIVLTLLAVLVLTSLVALLSRLTTLLFIFFHIVCHEIILPLSARRGAHLQFKSTAFN